MIARYPRLIPAGTVCELPAMNIDFFPTCLALAGLELPQDRIIDGQDITGLLTGQAGETPHEAFYFYHMDALEAIRVGKWKYIRSINQYVWPSPLTKEDTLFGGLAKQRVKYRTSLLFDLEQDPSESYNLIDNFPDVARELDGMMAEWERRVQANPRGWVVG
jgi:arylsulfatase A-like enzyme